MNYMWNVTNITDQFVHITEYQKEARRIRLSEIKTYTKKGDFTEITMFDGTNYIVGEEFKDFDTRLFAKQS